MDEASDILWNTNKSVDYALDVELPYANTRYELSVWARSRVANKSDEGFWSTAATVVFQSAADRTFFLINLIRRGKFVVFFKCVFRLFLPQ